MRLLRKGLWVTGVALLGVFSAVAANQILNDGQWNVWWLVAAVVLAALGGWLGSRGSARRLSESEEGRIGQPALARPFGPAGGTRISGSDGIQVGNDNKQWNVVVVGGGDHGLASGQACDLPDGRLADAVDSPHVVPSLPARYVERPAVLSELAGMLADRAVSGRRIALAGMGGAGKSVLAAAVTRLPGVRERFPDGVAWVSAGHRSLPQAQSELAVQFSGQPLGADVEENRLRLSRTLSGLSCLVVLDDVWDTAALDAFDCLSYDACLLVTTRDVGIARECGSYVEITELGFGQSRELLARWVGVEQQDLPPRADELCMEVGHLALGVATVGALVAAGGGGGRWSAAWDDVLARLRAADLDRVGHKFSNYEHRTLLRAIDVSLDGLDRDQRDRYHELAVFSAAAEVPRSAVEALWAPQGCASTDSGELLRLLASRSLLRHSDEGHVSLHDLQYDVAAYYLRQRPEGLTGGHRQLLSGYRERLSALWGSPVRTESVLTGLAEELLRRPPSDPLRQASDEYLLGNLALHLASAEQGKELRTLLTSYAWLRLGVTSRDEADQLGAGGVKPRPVGPPPPQAPTTRRLRLIHAAPCG